VEVLFNSTPVEFKEESVILEVEGQRREIPNDYAWIFAGGIPPNDFLKKIGVGFGARDMTKNASDEAKQAVAAKQAMETETKKEKEKEPVPVSSPAEEWAQYRLGIPGEELPKVVYRLDDTQKYEDKDILVIGGGDPAIHAAVSLSHAERNRVTLSYRGEHFLRLPTRNRQLIETARREKRVRVLTQCSVAAITPDSVILDVNGSPTEIPNDLVFVLLDSDTSVGFQPLVAASAVRPTAGVR
jgi:thioredoxin reductase